MLQRCAHAAFSEKPQPEISKQQDQPRMERLSLRPLLPRRNYFRRGDFRHTSVKQGCLGRYCDPETFPIRNRSPFSRPRPKGRSEEHTSELQSLMRISYAVFCLKK